MENFYTVAEYANLTGKDPGNIRRMLINGELKGEKAGKQWLIPKTEVTPPEDRRIKSGKYRGSRRRAAVRRSHPKLLDALNHMCEDLLNIYGEEIESIILYGSYVRGDETPDSDVDIALILKNAKDESKHEAMISLVTDYELEQGVVLSVVPIECEQYGMWKRVLPFYRSIEKEGLVLWSASLSTAEL